MDVAKNQLFAQRPGGCTDRHRRRQVAQIHGRLALWQERGLACRCLPHAGNNGIFCNPWPRACDVHFLCFNIPVTYLMLNTKNLRHLTTSFTLCTTNRIFTCNTSNNASFLFLRSVAFGGGSAASHNSGLGTAFSCSLAAVRHFYCSISPFRVWPEPRHTGVRFTWQRSVPNDATESGRGVHEYCR
jgi:hypothetical protein